MMLIASGCAATKSRIGGWWSVGDATAANSNEAVDPFLAARSPSIELTSHAEPVGEAANRAIQSAFEMEIRPLPPVAPPADKTVAPEPLPPGGDASLAPTGRFAEAEFERAVGSSAGNR